MIKRHSYLVVTIMLIIFLTAGCAASGTGSSLPAAPDDSSITALESAAGTEDQLINGADQRQTDEKSSDGQVDEAQINQPDADAEIDARHSTAAPMPISNKTEMGMARLIVTRDFGTETLFHEMVEIQPGWTIMDILQANLDIETRYGGGFIDSIDGLKGSSGGFTGEMQDWFYYVNGICPDVGGLDYVLNKGEVIWWDYHPWKAGPANAAVIGSYPEPFLHGYKGKVRGTTIMCSADAMELGHSIEQSLRARGVASIRVIDVDEQLLSNRQGPTIVIGVWQQLKQIPFLADFNQAYSRNGTGIHFNESQLEFIDFKGRVSRSIDGSAGVITASGSGLGDGSPLWLISGTDVEGLQGAVDMVINQTDKLSRIYNAAVVSGDVLSLPAH